MDVKQDCAKIVALASYLPSKVLTNADLEKTVDTSDQWILQRTGIKERRIAGADESTWLMGAQAALKLLAQKSIDPQSIDIVIVATMTPDLLSSSVAAKIQSEIGAFRAASLDIHAACTGFLYALSLAKAYIESKIYKRVLLVASEKMSAITDYTDRGTCILFGDGAAAALVDSKGPGLKIEHLCLGSDGNAADLISIPAGGVSMPATHQTVEARLHYLRLDGKEVFKNAVLRMAYACVDCLEVLKVTKDQISWFVPHQANMRIIDALAKKLEFDDKKIIKTVSKYGNTSASSIPIALEELLLEHPPKQDQLILLTAFGAGLTWGAGILRST